MRKIQEERQRLEAAKRQRMGAAAYAAQRGMMRGRGGMMMQRGGRGIPLRPGQRPGQRPGGWQIWPLGRDAGKPLECLERAAPRPGGQHSPDAQGRLPADPEDAARGVIDS